MRREFHPKVMIAAWDRANGCCEQCKTGRKLLPGDIFYDHVIPDAMGGEPTLDNCQVLCRSHHDAKTHKTDVPQIAKAKRRQRNHIGVKKQSSRPMLGTKASGVRKRMNGTVERW
jgi:5-methylcytosine-specific restriction protein A